MTLNIDITYKPVGDENALREDIESRGDRLKLWGARIALAVTFLSLWEFLSRNYVDPFWISSPSEVATRLWGWMYSGSLWFHFWITAQETAIGFVCGAITGVIAGFVLGRNEFLGRVLNPFILAFYSMPKIALAPLFIIWFGIDLLPKVVLAAVSVFFLVFYNTFAGVRETDKDLIDMTRLMGASRMMTLWLVVLPNSMVWIFTGLKISVPYALVAAVVGEMMASNKGLGYLISNAAGEYDTAGVFAALLILMIVATTLNESLNGLERKLLRWKLPTQ